MILPNHVAPLAMDTVTMGSLHMILPPGLDCVTLSLDVASSALASSSSLLSHASSSSKMLVVCDIIRLVVHTLQPNDILCHYNSHRSSVPHSDAVTFVLSVSNKHHRGSSIEGLRVLSDCYNLASPHTCRFQVYLGFV
jgi:hypothetical protein